MENECVASALTVLYDSDHIGMLMEKNILSGILFIDILCTNDYFISGCIVQLAHTEITMYFLLFYQFPLQQKLISFKIREYTNIPYLVGQPSLHIFF